MTTDTHLTIGGGGSTLNDMTTTAVSYLVTATAWDRLTTRTASLCEWFNTEDEALDRAVYLNKQTDRDGRHRYTGVKIELVNH